MGSAAAEGRDRRGGLELRRTCGQLSRLWINSISLRLISDAPE